MNSSRCLHVSWQQAKAAVCHFLTFKKQPLNQFDGTVLLLCLWVYLLKDLGFVFMKVVLNSETALGTE